MTILNEPAGGDNDGNSSDDALCEMLGLTSLDAVKDDADDDTERPIINILDVVQSHNLAQLYQSESVCLLAKELSISPALMRKLADEIIWNSEAKADRTYETVKVLKRDNVIKERRVLTRLENFVNHHDEWSTLCRGHIADCVSAIMDCRYVLFKEKLNLKPPGGAGFAPHLDTPSLRIALKEDGPQTFMTVMIAIDDMTISNGCLKVVRGAWSEENHVKVIEPVTGGNPDAEGRAGALDDVSLNFEPLQLKGGDIVVFSGYTPHRSAANMSAFARRAVFLTYNPASEGDFHDSYYEQMRMKRGAWRKGAQTITTELDALSTIPRI